ncbi:MAG: helix-turn-helix domain-containing protein [Polyangiaceae bacterium]|nr:helix-turn-helix domain-containing protein [Polyangiaceae bacterium]
MCQKRVHPPLTPLARPPDHPRARGNRSEAARQLGIGRPQLYAKMQEHGLGPKGEGE